MEAKVTLDQPHPPPPGLIPFLRAIAVALSRAVAGAFGWARDAIARGIIRVGIPANAVTLAGRSWSLWPLSQFSRETKDWPAWF